MADETTAPLSDAEIAGIDNRYFVAPSAAQWANIKERILGEMAELEYYDDAPYIIVRLLATLAAYREIVAAVAQMHTNDMRRAVVGSPDLITRARALLATSTPPATDATAGEEGE